MVRVQKGSISEPIASGKSPDSALVRPGARRQTRPPRRSPTARGIERGACAFRTPGRRARKLQTSLSGRETPCAPAHGCAGRAASGRTRSPARGPRLHTADPVRRVRAGPRRNAPPWRSPSARAEQDRHCRPSAPGTGRRTGRLRPRLARRTPERRGKAQSLRRAWPRRQLRSTPPVLLDTSARIFAIAASISASVRVRSRGCRITWMAIDFEPSGRPSP